MSFPLTVSLLRTHSLAPDGVQVKLTPPLCKQHSDRSKHPHLFWSWELNPHTNNHTMKALSTHPMKSATHMRLQCFKTAAWLCSELQAIRKLAFFILAQCQCAPAHICTKQTAGAQEIGENQRVQSINTS